MDALHPFRLYFLGDGDLLEVLGQGRSAAAVQPHLRKLFTGIHRVRTLVAAHAQLPLIELRQSILCIAAAASQCTVHLRRGSGSQRTGWAARGHAVIAAAHGCTQVRVAPGGGAVTAIVSGEGESVELVAPLALGDAVEAWLAGLTQVRGWRRRVRYMRTSCVPPAGV